MRLAAEKFEVLAASGILELFHVRVVTILSVSQQIRADATAMESMELVEAVINHNLYLLVERNLHAKAKLI